MLRNTGGPADGNATAPVQGVVLRVPLLYGHADKEKGESESAVHALVTCMYKAQYVKPESGGVNAKEKIRVDD